MKSAMAGATTNLAFTIMTLFFFLFISVSATKEFSDSEFSRKVSKAEMGMMKKREKVSHLHFYFHDIVSGRNPTAQPVARAATTNSSATMFGFLVMIDDPLTVGPNVSSRIVGRAQGLYGNADLKEDAIVMVFNFVFLEGKFNGSTLSVLGRNMVLSAVREMPILGGTGVFRFARGFAQARTHTYNPKTGDAVSEYNVYVLHY